MTSSVAPSQSLPQEVTSVRSGTLYAVVSEQFLMDSNIFDKIVDTPGALQLVETLVADGKVELLVTHVQEDELARIPDEQRRQRVALVPRTIAPTYGFVLDMSRLGMARFGEAAPIEAIRGGNWPKYTHDALIAATAQADGQVLVTEERRLQRRAETQLGVEVWNWQRWYAHLQSLT